MQTKIVGGGPPQLAGTELSIDPTFNAARVSLKPLDYAHLGQILGHYRTTIFTGATVSIGAKGILAYQRWTAASYLVLMRCSIVQAYVAATITAGTVVDAALYVGRGATAAGSGGGAVTLGGNNQKQRATMGASLVQDFRVATTGALTAPTSRTQDANPIGYAMTPASFQTTAPASGAPVTSTILTSPIDLFKYDTLQQHPVVLANNEDLEVVEYTAGPTTGGIAWGFLFDWAEVVLY